MDALRCPPPDADVTVLSGGERRRVALCKLLLQKPDLLLLDEPTNHLDAESVQWLEQHLAKYAGAVLAVTHDRYFLDNVAAVDPRARPRPRLPLRGQLLDLPGEEGRAARGRRAARTPSWPSGSRTSSSGCAPTPRAGRPRRKARLERYEEMAAEAERTRKLDFEEIQIPPGPRLGSVVIETNDLTKGFGDRVLIDDLSFTLPRNGIVGVIGPNGVGKTTLFKTIVGLEQPDERRGQDRRDGQDLLRRPEPRRARPEEERLGDRLRRPRLHQGRQRRDPVAGLRRQLRVQGSGPAEAGRRAVRRRAQPAQPRAHPQAGRQPAAARRADQRPRRRDPRLAGERAARVPRLRRGDQPRPVVPRPGGDAHPGLRGRRRGPGEVVLVRGQLRVLREEQGRAARRSRRPARTG